MITVNTAPRPPLVPVSFSRLCPLIKFAADTTRLKEENILLWNRAAHIFYEASAADWLCHHTAAQFLTICSGATYGEARYFIDQFVRIKMDGYRASLSACASPPPWGAESGRWKELHGQND